MEPMQTMNNTMRTPNHNKASKQKSFWETTQSLIQPRLRVKDAQSSPSQDAESAGCEGSERCYNVDKQLRLFVGTWNVAGKIPTDKWVMREWLGCQEAADVYVIGFQEIVPLRAGNVLGNEDKGVSARKWDELIMKALNESCCSSAYLYSCSSSDSELANMRTTSSTIPSYPSSFDGSWFHACSYEEDMGSNIPGGALLRRPISNLYTSSQDGNGCRHSSAEEICSLARNCHTPSDPTKESALMSSDIMPTMPSPEYVKIASKQLVGLFISVWVRQKMCRHVKAVNLSAVGCGIMGHLGNKGSISVSLSLHETNFCFICSHLKSGDRPNDIARRNSDVDNILKRTKFHRTKRLAALDLPKTILGHDHIIWFGDLNYRVSLPFEDIKQLVTKRNWGTLLEKDQLKIEQGRGGVLEGWNEAPVCFPPTYKFLPNSDTYILMQHQRPQNAAQKCAPAWCDRILWYGKGLKQLSYTSNTHLRHSDHRPVSAMFIAGVEVMLEKPLFMQDTLLNKVESKIPSMTVGIKQKTLPDLHIAICLQKTPN